MKTIQRKDFSEVGSAVKVHGTKGELKFSITREIKLKEWAFLEFRGKPVPFFIESSKADLGDEIILKLQGLDSIEQAEAVLGSKFLLPNAQVKKDISSDEWDLENYLVLDVNHGELGVIVEILEYPYQTLAKVIYKEAELLFPLVDELIVEIDDDKRELLVCLPEGLLDIH